MGRPKTTRPMPWLRQRLRAVNAKSTDLARHLDIPPARVYEMIKGHRQFQTHEIQSAAEFLKIGEVQLLDLIEGRIEATDVGIKSLPAALPWVNLSNTSVPLLAATLAPNGRWLLHATKQQATMSRPDFLRFSITAFAVVVQDERNSPVYRVRDRILIDPDSLVTAGDDVVLSTVADLDMQQAPHVILGHLEEMSDVGWSLRQYANGQESSFSRTQFTRAWKIVSRFMGG